MIDIVAIYGSPRRRGNTAAVLARAVAGAREGGAVVEEVVLRDLKISPCLEIYGCKNNGRCVINDDFQPLVDKLSACQGLMLASPMMFYAVSGHVKAMMDRCQSLWVKKYWLERRPFGQLDQAKAGLFVSVGATTGKKLFDGALLSVKYFMDTLDMPLWRSLLYRGLDHEGEAAARPEIMAEAHAAGLEMAQMLSARAAGLPG